MRICLKIIKYALYLTPALIVVIVITRLILSGDPPESRVIVNTYNFESAYRNLGGDFIMYKINARNPFALGDTFCVADILYLESSRDLQLSFRGKKNRLEELRAYLNAADGNYADLLNLYLRVTTNTPAGAPDEIREETAAVQVFEASARFLFENDRYEYIRVNFSDIDIDYRRTKLELIAFDSARGYDLDNLDNLDNSDDADDVNYIARVTLFDINMPKERVQIEKFEVLN